MYDLIIIGLGTAGFSASIYAKRAGLNVAVIEMGAPGGALGSIKTIENYLGYENVSGPDLAMHFYKQFKALKLPMINEEVIDIKDEETSKIIYTNQDKYEAKAIIIATGRGQKKLSVGHNVRGVSYCALCDANLYQGKRVALVGNNPKAIEEALYLSDIAKKVSLIIHNDRINASADNTELLKQKQNIEIIYNEEIRDIIEEDNKVHELILKDQNVHIDGLFASLGFGPATYFCDNLNITDEQGYITVNAKLETKVKGIYACGDNIKKEVYQIITAASEGATAAINANKYLKGIK